MARIFTLIFITVCIITSIEAREKTDSLFLKNGNVITGEIKSLELGKLSFGTDDMGTLKVEWDKIKGMESDTTFLITVSSGTVFYGSLDTSGIDGKDLVILYEDTFIINHMDIVMIQPKNKRILDNLDGYVNLGFSFLKANKHAQLTGDIEAIYRAQRASTELSSTLLYQNQSDTVNSRKESITLTHSRYSVGTWFYGASVGYEKNTALNLYSRLQLIGFYGNYLIRTNFSQLSAYMGLAANNEVALSTRDATYNTEALTSLQFRTYRYDDPELDISTTVTYYQGLNDFQRSRVDISIKVRWEMLNNLYLTLSMYDNFDSKQPSSNGTRNNDYGLVSGLEFTF